ncbi:hypothetical protein NUW58_g6865 [Xylaria curta]|uniref:Uncharacterized protein n=1 Tax=Xylaria curta TaxID=42375 RepID=A0ACC1NQR8_9PEZI|nr:hypothetical protein NUW58_g6865 [Xylaria curta]
MAFSTRTLPGHMRQGSTNSNPNAQSTGQSAALLARVNEKKAELENLRELRDLSAAVADQMEALQQKLATLSDGTEAIATVVGNWHNVLQAINMASAKIPNPRAAENGQTSIEESEVPLPQTLVRIPTEHAPALQAQAELAMENENEQEMMSHKSPYSQGFEILCDPRSEENQPLGRHRDSVSARSQPLRRLSISQTQNRQLEKVRVGAGIHELDQVSFNPRWSAIQKNEKRVGGRLTRPSITPTTFDVLSTVSESDSQTQSVPAASRASDNTQQILHLPADGYSSHPLSIAARNIPPLKEQLGKHRDGLFEWVLAVKLPSDTRSRRDNSAGTNNSKDTRKAYFGCNLLPESSPQGNGSVKTARPMSSYSLIATPLKETKDVLEVFRDPVQVLDMACPEAISGQNTPARASNDDSRRRADESTPISTRCIGGDDSPADSIISRSQESPVTRIEDSFEALDILEDQLEAFDQVARFNQFIPAEKPLLTKEPLGKTEFATPGLSVRFATPQPQRTSIKPNSGSLRVKSATEPRRTGLRKATSMNFDLNKFGSEGRTTIRGSPEASACMKATKSSPRRLAAKSTKQLTIPSFELPGEAVARQLKEKKEARLASQRATQPTAASLSRARSVKLPTRPTFELPGEAISRRKREEHRAQLKMQEEEEKKRREFKARPPPSHVVPTTLPRETIASRARQNRAPLAESSARTLTPHKRPSTTMGSHSRQSLSSTLSQAQQRGRGLQAEESSTARASRATSASTNSLSGKHSLLSIEDIQMQKLRGHEIYQRDNSWTDNRMREKYEREELAKLAREEAAEKSRQKSREWAMKQARKRMTINSPRDGIV